MCTDRQTDLIDRLQELPWEAQQRILAELVSNGLQHLGIKLPKTELLISARLLGGVGTEHQIRSAKKELRCNRFITPPTRRAISAWVVAESPFQLKITPLVEWYLLQAASIHMHTARGPSVFKILSGIESLIQREEMKNGSL